MTTIHITNGDVAATSLRAALASAQRNEEVLALRDDLAFGPIRAVDSDVHERAAFWQQVLDEQDRDVASELNEQNAALARLVESAMNIVVWHAQSASDQLMLRRVAWYLRTQPQRLNEVALGARELPRETAPRADGASAIGMFGADALATRIRKAAPISVLRIGRLALEWQDVRRLNGDVRCWRENRFVTGTYAPIDDAWLQHTDDRWQMATHVAARVMKGDFGACVTDAIALWRCRELATAGRLALSGEARRQWRDVQVRRP
ncbi:Hypothetical protein RBRH_00377 [Mycetohabitans rhizoxinica HKI 454]|uniref:DUF1835 domain-containing protein n=1 Tax=Mycetohabitans rhizoxinica (strain DSM 19002 / CIP 109453 / HKI 454) TaxID=882378 RepID=E5ALE5_MYCRK|nr:MULTISPECIES: DUF1835 domain-containing protein [Mycetohabitans]MCG1046122.1 DUF1835 domain-containing protein [Mycetohabitans sp. B6]CBW73818.1 Hypothetical protein RBRH_00377 [Mycetohabitans rhizoxinica HKI 454]